MAGGKQVLLRQIGAFRRSNARVPSACMRSGRPAPTREDTTCTQPLNPSRVRVRPQELSSSGPRCVTMAHDAPAGRCAVKISLCGVASEDGASRLQTFARDETYFLIGTDSLPDHREDPRFAALLEIKLYEPGERVNTGRGMAAAGRSNELKSSRHLPACGRA
jgi:hypothetical protein